MGRSCRGPTTQQIWCQILCGAVLAANGLASGTLPEEALIVPGTLPIDTDGNPVHAHGGGILKVKDTFFWFGESYKRPLLKDFLSEGVNLYSSTDFATWHYEGLVFNGTEQMKGMPVEAPFRIERPKILYNEATNQYVLLFHADTPKFGYPAVGVAVAKDIRGPYTWVRVFKPDGLDSYDMGVFQEDDGTAFLVRSVKNEYVGISQLSPDYTDTLGISSTVPRAEGPAVFKAAASSYYMMGSHLSGWAPNPPLLFHSAAPSLLTATWIELPVPAKGEGANITYNSQSTFVFPLEFDDGTVLYVYMGDRWNFYEPGSVETASYVWLPLLPRSDGMGYELHYEKSWRPADFRERARLPVALNNGTAPLQLPPSGAATETTGGARVQGGAAGAATTGAAEPTGAAAKRTPANPPPGLAEFNGPATSSLSNTPASAAPAPSRAARTGNVTSSMGGAAIPAPAPRAGAASAESFARRAVSRVEAWLSG